MLWWYAGVLEKREVCSRNILKKGDQVCFANFFGEMIKGKGWKEGK